MISVALVEGSARCDLEPAMFGRLFSGSTDGESLAFRFWTPMSI